MALPPEIAGQLNLDGPPATPRPAATVLLARPADPWQLLMVHRPGGADFAPGAYVFPGGGVHEEDRGWSDGIAGAAVRETFEETGILLARRAGTFARDSDCDAVREKVAGGSSFAEALKHLSLDPAFDALVMFARWVTPAQLRRRFDTRFYVAEMPSEQKVHPQEGEVTDWLWISPRRALDTNEITLVYATRAILQSVAQEPSVDALFARARALSEIPVVEPRVVQTEAGWKVVRE
jgi:8-oxo-dGTP pyrophosphatase MutT (NUDIX family)